jgi:plastocyanin
LIWGSISAMRASVASTTAREVTSPSRMRRACSAAPAKASVMASIAVHATGRDLEVSRRPADADRKMSVSVRRLLVMALVAALGGGATAQAVAKPAKKSAKHRKARKATAKKAQPRARAIKLDAGVAWVPLEAFAGAPPLTGTTGMPASPGPGSPTAPATNSDPTSSKDTAPPPGSGDTPQPPSSQAVGVTVDDRTGYTARLSRAGVTAGSVVVQLHNQGEDDHNLRVVPTDHAGATVEFPLTGAGQNTTKTLALTAGKYRLFCTLTTPVNHETAGMNATLTVS